jgi:hypothetical protein
LARLGGAFRASGLRGVCDGHIELKTAWYGQRNKANKLAVAEVAKN